MQYRVTWLGAVLALACVSILLQTGCGESKDSSDNQPPVIHSLEVDHQPLVPYSAAVLMEASKQVCG